MSGIKEDLPGRFAERYEDFRETPFPDVWTAIEEKLKQEKRKKKRFIFWLMFSAIAMSICLFGIYTNCEGEKTIATTKHSTNERSRHVASRETAKKAIEQVSGTSSSHSINNTNLQTKKGKNRSIPKTNQHKNELKELDLPEDLHTLVQNETLLPALVERITSICPDSLQPENTIEFDFCTFALAMDSSTKEKQKNRFSRWSYIGLIGLNQSLGTGDSKNLPKELQMNPQLSVLLLMNYRFNSRFSLETGFNTFYHKMTYSSEYYSNVFRDQWLAIPLRAAWYMNGYKRFQFSAYGGFNMEYQLWRKDEFTSTTAGMSAYTFDVNSLDYYYSISNSSALSSGTDLSNKFNIRVDLGTTFQYRLNEHFQLRFSPAYHMYVLKSGRYGLITFQRNHWLGFEGGLIFNFR